MIGNLNNKIYITCPCDNCGNEIELKNVKYIDVDFTDPKQKPQKYSQGKNKFTGKYCVRCFRCVRKVMMNSILKFGWGKAK